MKKQDFENAQQGSGSAENKGDHRDEQKHPLTNTSKDQQKDIAHEAGLGRNRMSDIEDMGGLSGRDDYAGSTSDDMSNTSTNEPTER